MAKLAKSLAAASGSAALEGLDITDLFSTFLYEGDNSNTVMNNGVNLADNGGLVWTKARDSNGTLRHYLTDSARGMNKQLNTDTTSSEGTLTDLITTFNTTGYTKSTNIRVSGAAYDFVSWSFLKAPKFFDVLTYSGNNTNNRQIAHNLGSVPGCIIVKAYNENLTPWSIYHRGVDSSMDAGITYPEDGLLEFTNSKAIPTSRWANTAPTSTHFTISNDNTINKGGTDYVAYIFAHNNGDGEFGQNAEQDIIKCGVYTGNGNTTNTINLGFEPQFLLTKIGSSSGDWMLFDRMRGLSQFTDPVIYPNLDHAEESRNYYSTTANGFKLESTSTLVNASNTKYLYIAIRKGPLLSPESSSTVFSIDTAAGTAPTNQEPNYKSGQFNTSAAFPVDMALQRETGANENWVLGTRKMEGTNLRPNDVNQEDAGASALQFDYQNGYGIGTNTNNQRYAWMFRYAHGFFDIVNYSGNNSNGRDINHNLGVVPEMMWVKARTLNDNWMVGTQSEGDAYTKLNDYDGFTSSTTRLRMTGNTATTFQVGNDTSVNASSNNYVAYLFASISGVSKVGTYTGNGTSQNIDCGFSNGAKLIIIKSTGAASANWVLIDSQRGLSNELYINDDLAEGTSSNVTAYSGGFALTNTNHVSKNANGTDYIFYAIAAP